MRGRWRARDLVFCSAVPYGPSRRRGGQVRSCKWQSRMGMLALDGALLIDVDRLSAGWLAACSTPL